MPFPRAKRETQADSSRIWTQVANFIPYDDNRYARSTFYYFKDYNWYTNIRKPKDLELFILLSTESNIHPMKIGEWIGQIVMISKQATLNNTWNKNQDSFQNIV